MLLLFTLCESSKMQNKTNNHYENKYLRHVHTLPINKDPLIPVQEIAKVPI